MRNGLIVDEDGNKIWYKNALVHREDGPAYEGVNGDKEWYINGKSHREDGPAVEYADGTKVWYLNGKYIDSYEEFIRLVKLKALW